MSKEKLKKGDIVNTPEGVGKFMGDLLLGVIRAPEGMCFVSMRLGGNASRIAKFYRTDISSAKAASQTTDTVVQ